MASCKLCGRELGKNRSDNQNRYYWGVVVSYISEKTGFTIEEAHEILKHKFLSVNKTWNDMVFYIPKSTSSLSTSQMEEYLSKVRKWAAETLNLNIPEPNENEELSYLPLNRRKNGDGLQ